LIRAAKNVLSGADTSAIASADISSRNARFSNSAIVW